MNAIVPVEQSNVAAYRAATDAADMCKAIVVETAMEIQGRKYVKVEGWQAIAVAHGCTASATNVERVEGGVKATGIVRRMSDGVVIAEGEGFVGEDETTWFGGVARKWKWGQQRGQKVWYEEEVQKRPDYAIRAMAQTRAISRACRAAFAHVVVMMNADLSTTPAEEVPQGGFEAVQDAEFTEVEPAPKAQKRQPEKQDTPFDEPEQSGGPNPDDYINDRTRNWLQARIEAAGRTVGDICKEEGIQSLKEIKYSEADRIVKGLKRSGA